MIEIKQLQYLVVCADLQSFSRAADVLYTTQPNVSRVIRSLETEECPMLEEIEREALEEGVPIIRKETQSFLKTLISLQRPEKVLEIGTGAGFSALLMCEYAPEECRFVTIENYEKRILGARENFRRAGREQQIT